MKKRAEQSLYEVLEVPPTASAGEIRGSYERLRKLLGPGSLAMYSLVEPAEAEALLLRLDEAWAVLSDASERRRYDASIGLAPAVPAVPVRNSFRDAVATIGRAVGGEVAASESPRVAEDAPEFVLDEDDLLEVVEVPGGGMVVARAAGSTLGEGELLHGDEAADLADPADPADSAAADEPAGDPIGAEAEVLDADEIGAEPEPPLAREPDVGPDTVFTGDLLRRIRLARGLSLDEIARRTRIGANHLANIEEERWADLPERVFLRGYLAAYAGELHLDPVQVYTSYLDRHSSTRRH